MGDLKGRDVNGMHAAQWGKLDTSAISKVKVPDKCTNDQLASAVKQMLVEAVEKLYGTNKDKKYVKIVDMIMMRVRGALEKLNDQIQKAQEENSKSFDVDELISELSKTLTKIVEENSKTRDKDISGKLQKVYKSVNELIENETKKSNDENSQNTDNKQDKIQGQQDQNTKSSGSIEDFDKINTELQQQHDSSQNQLQLLEDLQKQITDNFSKIENLITANSMQKNAEAAAVQMNKPVDQQIIDRQKKNESTIKEQIQSINSKTEPDIKKPGENEKDDKKVDKERKKKREKQKKNDLKNIMTGKQFGQLKKLLVGQFYDVVETSDIIVKKVNKGFKAINNRLDKIIKDRKKYGFSWTKLIFFLSIFLIPLLFSNVIDFIKNFLKNLIQEFDINKIIETFISKIDWMQHINAITGGIWKSIKKKFDTFISNPMKLMISLTKDVYKKCTEWVKELWRWVTGSFGSEAQKKKQKEQDKKMKEDEKRLNQAIERSEKAGEQSLEEVSQQAEIAAKTSVKDVKKTVDDTSKNVEQSQKDIQSKIVKSNQISDEANAALKGMSDQALKQTDGSVQKSLEKVDTTVKDVVMQESKNIQKQADANMKSLADNGSPTTLKPTDIERMANVDGLLGNADVSKVPSLPTPIDGLQNITAGVQPVTTENAYSQVNLPMRDKTTEADGFAVPTDELKTLINNNSGKTNSDMVERLQNRTVFGQYVPNDSVEYTNAWQNYQNKKLNKSAAMLKRNKFVDQLTGKNENKDEVSLTEAFNKASQIYGNIDTAFKVVVDNSATIENGVNENKKQLTLLKEDVNNYFDKLNEIAKNLKPVQKNNNTLAVIPAPKLDSSDVTSAQMK